MLLTMLESGLKAQKHLAQGIALGVNAIKENAL